MNPTITIYFDGGCRPTNPGNIYGSYEVLFNGIRVLRENRLEMGWGTNNDAEFKILEFALKATLKALEQAGNDPRTFALALFSDSMIVLNRLNGKVKASTAGRTGKKRHVKERMNAHSDACRSRIDRFKEFTATWNGRATNVKIFGH